MARPPRTNLRIRGSGLGLLAVMVATWYVGAGQSNGAADLLCFTLAGLALASIPHTWANLRGARVEMKTIEPVFAGGTLALHFILDARPGGRHWSVSLAISGGSQPQSVGSIVAGSIREVILYLPASSRGRFEEVTLHMQSSFPLSFVTAKRTFELPQTFYVYPAAVGALPLPAPHDPLEGANFGPRAEGDDFAGVREWRAGESMRHVDWKAAARGHRLQVKQWDGAGAAIVCLDWESLDGLSHEGRLCQLCTWILQAEQRGVCYGLRMPGAEILPSRGESHKHDCLRLLAAFQASDTTPSFVERHRERWLFKPIQRLRRQWGSRFVIS